MSKAVDYFVAYDFRRGRWQVKPMGWVAVFLALVLAAGAGLGAWRGLAGRVTPARAPQPTAVSGPSTATRPVSWPVWQEQTATGVAYQVPPEVKHMAVDDFKAAMAWWEGNLLKPDVLEQGLATYFAGPELVRRRESAAATRQFDTVGIVYQTEPFPENYPQAAQGVQWQSAGQDGQTAFVAHYVGRRQAAFYRVSDGALLEGSQDNLPAMTLIYRLAFDAATRRWLVDDQVLVYDMDTSQTLKGDQIP